jgi:outer membrane lipoprotein carrier protein
VAIEAIEAVEMLARTPLHLTRSDLSRRGWLGGGLALALAVTGVVGAAAPVADAMAQPAPATGDAVASLRDFVRSVQSARSAFTQTVTSPDGSRRKVSSGQFEFVRPNRFRFSYTKPYEQLIVADGQKVWIHDPDLNQASSRQLAQVLGSTPAALLAGGSIDADFELAPLPSRDGLALVQATPRQGGGSIQSLRVGFRGASLAELEIFDSFGQRSRIVFSGFEPNAVIAAERFRFTPPPGTDVIAQ